MNSYSLVSQHGKLPYDYSSRITDFIKTTLYGFQVDIK
jgi:hypothetical protein